jgi:protein SCO1/2
MLGFLRSVRLALHPLRDLFRGSLSYNPGMQLPRHTIIIVLLAVAGFALGAIAAWHTRQPGREAPAAIEGLLWPNPRSVSAVDLVDQGGRPFTLERLRGQWSLVFFGFTRCPDVCPTTLTVLRDALRELRATAGAQTLPQVVLVSVDPERDTPAAMKSYVEFFDPEFIGATGAPAQVDALTRELGIVHMKVPLAGGDYTVDHTAAVLLLDPQARLVGLLSAPHAAPAIAAKYLAIRRFVEAAP